MEVLYIYLILAALFLVAGLIVMFTGIANKKKPLKLAGIVIAVMGFQVIVLISFFLLLFSWGQRY